MTPPNAGVVEIVGDGGGLTAGGAPGMNMCDSDASRPSGGREEEEDSEEEVGVSAGVQKLGVDEPDDSGDTSVGR